MFTLALPGEVILRRNFGERYFGSFAHIIREKFLDTIDAQIEAQHLTAAVVEERPSRETEGFKVVGAVPLKTRRERERLIELGGALEAVSARGPARPALPLSPPPPPDMDRTVRV